MNRKFIIQFALLVFSSVICFAQDKYAVNEISQELFEKANAVIRNAATQIEIKNDGRFFINRKYAITIFNSAAEDEAQFIADYSKFNTVKNISGTLYDASGKKLKTTKKSDISDVSGTSESELADDHRIKAHNFHYNIYPYTVEYEYEEEYLSAFYFPRWIPVNDANISVEESSLSIQMPASYQLRYKMYNYKNEPSSSVTKETKTLEWIIKKVPAFTRESYSSPWYELTPSVLLAPSNFQLQNYSGNMTDWNNFGKFMYQLNAGRDKLPEQIKNTIHQLSDNLSDNEKIRKLYEYLQKTTRYISIQLGIGGWQTYDANYVAGNGYGDCKALSNYMCSILKEAGITAYSTLIYGGKGHLSFIPDFTSNQFNHVIVCVPGKNDTTWLECTSQTTSAGYLGQFTSNRPALVITEEGGKLVRTPRYNFRQNLQSRKIYSDLDAEGNLKMKISTRYMAEQEDDVQGLVNAVSKNIISEYLKDKLSIPSYDVMKWNYNEEKKLIPSIQEELEVLAHNYATLTGKRIFITPNILNRSGAVLNDADKRITPLIINMEYTDIDSIEINVPQGYEPETSSADVTVESKFGKYYRKTEFKNGKINYIRFIERYSGTFPPSDAVALSDFLNTISKADRMRIVLIKAE